MVGARVFRATAPPRTPDDLARHSCVRYRRAADGAMFEWPFERDGKSRQISVDGRIMVNDIDLAIRAAVNGVGIAYAVEAAAEPFLRSGGWFACWRSGRPNSKGSFSIIPATGKCRSRCAP